MSFDLTPPHFCQFPGCGRLGRATPMARHQRDADDQPRIVWVCAKHSLLFYAGDVSVTARVHDGPETARVDASPAPL
jgi:hypothetical protein